LRDDLRFSVCTLAVSQKALIVEYGLALLKSLTKSPGDILADAFGFRLCEPCVDDQIEFAVDLQCVYILLLEVDANPSCPERSDVVQAVNGVSVESGDRLADNVVDFSRQAVVDQLLELGALICTCPGDALICVESGKLPFGLSGNHLGIYLFLFGIGCELLLAVGGYPAVGSNQPLMILLPVDD